MKNFWVEMEVVGYHAVNVEANSIEEAEELALSKINNKNFGALDNIEASVAQVFDEDED